MDGNSTRRSLPHNEHALGPDLVNVMLVQVPTMLRTRIDNFFGEAIHVKDERVDNALPRRLQSQLDLVMNRSLFTSVPFCFAIATLKRSKR
eukprot:7381804-Prymnesium_polylepis.2